MALDTYANLKASIESWSHRGDVKNLIDDFILIAETEMFNGDEAQLRIRGMVATETGSTGTGDRFQALPSGYLELRSFKFTESTNNQYELDYLTPKKMRVRDGTGTPAYFTITSQIEYDVEPKSDFTTDIVYYQQPTGLSSSNTTNTVLDNYPQIYLYGALWALNQWAVNDAEEAKYYAKFIKAISGANASDNDGSMGVAVQRYVQGRNP